MPVQKRRTRSSRSSRSSTRLTLSRSRRARSRTTIRNRSCARLVTRGRRGGRVKKTRNRQVGGGVRGKKRGGGKCIVSVDSGKNYTIYSSFDEFASNFSKTNTNTNDNSVTLQYENGDGRTKSDTYKKEVIKAEDINKDGDSKYSVSNVESIMDLESGKIEAYTLLADPDVKDESRPSVLSRIASKVSSIANKVSSSVAGTASNLKDTVRLGINKDDAQAFANKYGFQLHSFNDITDWCNKVDAITTNETELMLKVLTNYAVNPSQTKEKELLRGKKKKLIKEKFAKYKEEAVYKKFFAKQHAQQTE